MCAGVNTHSDKSACTRTHTCGNTGGHACTHGDPEPGLHTGSASPAHIHSRLDTHTDGHSHRDTGADLDAYPFTNADRVSHTSA